MTNRDRNLKPLTEKPTADGYEVGYGKPPTATRFKPGQSGNPRGRRKGSKNRTALPSLNEERLKSIVIEEAYRTITISDVRGEVKIPMAQAIIRSLAVNAAKGNQRAQRLFAELLSATERENKRLYDEWLQTAIEYKIDWENELERRRANGVVAPDPIPHPDHVIIDMRTGSVRIKGPMTREEKVEFDRFADRMRQCDESIAAHEQELREQPDHPHRKFILEDIAFEKKIRAIITKAIPD